MNIILIKPNEIINGITEIKDARYQHIRDVLKSDIGSTVKAGILQGNMGTATIKDYTDDSVILEPHCDTEPPKAPEISIVLALPRPKVFRRVLFGMVCSGIKNIHIINSWRVDKSYWESPYLDPAKIDEYCFDALSQAKDTIMPKISFHRYFMNFINETVPKLPDGGRYFAHPYNSGETGMKRPCTVVIGCEGGFIEKEVQTFIRCDFEPFSLGDRILTTEYAVPYILGMLN